MALLAIFIRGKANPNLGPNRDSQRLTCIDTMSGGKRTRPRSPNHSLNWHHIHNWLRPLRALSLISVSQKISPQATSPTP